MKLPNKFWFYHKLDSSKILFAARDEHNYAIPGVDLVPPNTITTDDVKYLIQYGHWILTVPDKFCVRGLLTDMVYSMIKEGNGLYVLKNQETGDVFFHRYADVLSCVYGVSPLWEIVEDTSENSVVKPLQTNPYEKPDKKPEKKLISINVNDVRAAAEFDVANNPHTKAKGNTVEEIECEILRYLREMYDTLMNGDTEWELRYTGTRTYRILFQPEDDHYGTISILSDTSVGMPTFFADVNDFLSQN